MRNHMLAAVVGIAAVTLCAPAHAGAAKHAARSVTVVFQNRTSLTLTHWGGGLGNGYGRWVTQPPKSIAPWGSARWKSESSKALKGVGGFVDFKSIPGTGIIHVAWDNPFVGTNSYSYSAPAGYGLEKSGGSGNDTTVTFTLAPPFVMPKNTKVTSLKVRVLTGSDFGAGTDDDVYFDIGPMGWLLDKPHYNDFERNADDTYDLNLSGVSLNTDDIIHARLQKKGIGGWTGAPDSPGGAWKAQSMHFIVNGQDSGKIDVNQWFDQKHEFWTHKLQTFDPYETFIRTLRMTANPELTGGSENVAILTTPFKMMGLSGWMGSDVGTVTAIGTVVYKPGQSTDGLATIDMKLESIHLSKNNKTYVFDGKNKTPGINGPRYLRTEYKFRKFGAFTGGKPLPDKGDRVSISGPIAVDTDHEGYFEIHPDKPAQVAILPKS